MSNKKQIFKVNTLKRLLIDENSCVSLVPTTRLLALPPFFLNDMKSGILYLLNNMLKKYDRSLGGIVIGYQNIKVLMDENTGIIPMGTSETEVNISVEFYIFQPKIGSFLEGVVNKKSNSHVGCLVHRYFNATILKPEDVDYDEWICHDFNVDDKIIFKVKDLDFTSMLPLIEGVIDDGRLLDKVKTNINGSLDFSSDIVNSVNMIYSNKVLFSENGTKSSNNKRNTLKDNFNKNSLEFDSFTNLGRKKKEKKKKKEEKELLDSFDSHKQMDKEEGLNDKEWISDTLSKEYSLDERYYIKKKKKKDKKKQEDADVTNIRGSLNGNTSDSCNNSEKLKTFENKNIDDFVKPGKIKKGKKKNKRELEELHAELNKTNQYLFLNEAEDDIFYSTQLDSSLPKKMKICCSPISKSTSFEEKSPKGDLKNQKEVDAKEKRQKHKKRKREEKIEPQGLSEPKKIKTSYSSFSENESTKDKMNFNEDGSIVRTMMNELCRKQLDKVREELYKSEKNSSKERKKKKKKLKNDEKMLSSSKDKGDPINGEGGTEQNSEIYSLLDELRKQEMQRVKEELNISGSGRCKEIKKIKVKVKKEEKETFTEEAGENLFNLKKSTKVQLNGTGDFEKKFSVQDMMDQLLKEEINRVKEGFQKSDAKTKEGKKAKKVISKQEEISEEKTHDSLYEKLLKEAKSAMDLGEDKSSSLSLAREPAKKKKKDFSNLTSSFKNRDSVEKKDRNSQKTKNCPETPEKYKNGSMYDAALTPKKMNFEKSLFSDSEQSNNSPAKRQKEINGIEVNFIEQSPFKKETEAEKNVLGKKKERRSHKSEQDHDALYEKLLREAKTLIQSINERSPIKKKHLAAHKNKKMITECLESSAPMNV